MRQLIVLLVAVAACAASSSEESEDFNHFDTVFDNSTVVSAEEYNANPDAFMDSIFSQGVWVKWNGLGGGMPRYAVYAGFESYGPSFVMRAEHSHNGQVIKIVGKYFPYKGRAYIPYGNKEISKGDIEVLTQYNHRWMDKDSATMRITSTTSPLIQICRGKYGRLFVPGKLVREYGKDKCYYPAKGGEFSPPNYEILCIGC